ncbi:vitamin D-binding protein [Amia ocellicauda]|uniref:vitamin D-binding protein n=1 Tax=Amia ocellicauda TaxID=2972642 RepID=UPI0034649F7B
MKITCIVVLMSAFDFVYSISRGKHYVKEKVCQEYAMLGKEKFKAIGMVLYSQKFSTGTFEEVNAVTDEMVKLAETCCTENSSADCYDTGATAMSEMSCSKDSPFPKHPGIASCCKEDGLERKLCLAALRVTSEELPSLQESTNEEICQKFKEDPKEYSLRYFYEFSRRHGSIPAGLILNATDSYLRMVGTCCSLSESTICFLRERLQLKDSNHFLRLTSNLCHNQAHLPYFKIGLTAYYGHILNDSLEDILPITTHLQEGLSKCCLNPNPECLITELMQVKTVLCNDTSLSGKYRKLHDCCSKPPLDVLSCVETSESESPPQQTEIKKPTDTDLCKEGSATVLDKYFFEIGRKHNHLTLPVLASVFADIGDYIHKGSACKLIKKSPLEKIETFVSKTDGLCQQYKKLDFTVFKERLVKSVQEEMPDASKTVVDTKAKQWVEFTSTCCSRKAPALRCRKLIDLIVGDTRDD